MYTDGRIEGAMSDLQTYDNSLGSVMGGWCAQLVHADAIAGEANTNKILRLLVDPKTGKARAPVEVDDSFDFSTGPDDKNPAKGDFKIRIPPIILAENSSFMPTKATLDMSMNVTTHSEDHSELAGKQSLDASGKVGYGPFSLGVRIHAEMSERQTSTRSSDQRAKTDAHLEMGRVGPSEGVAEICDFIRTMTRMERDIALMKARQAFGAKQRAENAPAQGAADAAGDAAPAGDAAQT